MKFINHLVFLRQNYYCDEAWLLQITCNSKWIMSKINLLCGICMILSTAHPSIQNTKEDLSKICFWAVIAHYRISGIPAFHLHFYDNKTLHSHNICIEDQAFGHRPLPFFVADIISHSHKPYSHTPWQYANNVPGLPLYCHTLTVWEEHYCCWGCYQIPWAFKKWQQLIIMRRRKQRDLCNLPNAVWKWEHGNEIHLYHRF